jgi:DMSO reductase anchor subunit
MPAAFSPGSTRCWSGYDLRRRIALTSLPLVERLTMHPAASIIAFTTMSGLGYGLAAMLGLGLLDPAAWATWAGHGLALALIAGGLLCSTLHLGNPQRAWRALSQWRTSWLSREGVAAIASFVPISACAWYAVFEGRYVPAWGVAAVLLSIVTVYSTAMIYASLRAVDAWHTRLTPACYLLFAAAGGAVLATLLAASGGGSHRLPAAVACVLLVAAWVAKLAWRRNMRRAVRTSTPESATGLGRIGAVRPFEAPHANPNYLTREMGFRVERRRAARLFGLALLAGGILPAALMAGTAALGPGWPAIILAAAAAILHPLGMLVERWLFFAEARHAVANYYGG